MQILHTLQVNERGSRENLVAGDLLDGWTLDRAIAVLSEHKAGPLIGPLFGLILPMRAWLGLFMGDAKWQAVGPGGAAIHPVKPLIAAVFPSPNGSGDGGRYPHTGEGVVYGRDYGVIIEFALP